METLVIVLVFAAVALIGAAAESFGVDSRDFDANADRTTNLGER